MEIKGKITFVAQPEYGTSSRGPWTKQGIIVEYESGQYPKSIGLTNMNKAEEFGKLLVGQTGTFKFDCKAREYNGKIYNDLNCWSWQLDQPQPTPQSSDDPI